MAFLDNSGDIILDAVLTDTGRLRLARGDGSFRIAKFALGDDEIDYGKYNYNNASGSAYYDLEIMKTPIFEAFTNNTATLQSKLISISRTDLLYLPILKLNTKAGANATFSTTGMFYVSTDATTTNALASADLQEGILRGDMVGGQDTPHWVRVDQGLDTIAIPPTNAIPASLFESQYIVEMDNRFGSLYGINGAPADVSFVDDDQIASYFLSKGANTTTFITSLGIPNADNLAAEADQVIEGPRGSSLTFKIKASLDLMSTSTYLFTQLGSTVTVGSAGTFYSLDSTIRITGATTGYRMDVPIRYIKFKSA